MYSLIGSARLNGIDRETYLHYVIERITGRAVNRIDELLERRAAVASLRTHQSHSLTVHIVVVNEIRDGANYHQINAAV